MLTIFVLDVWNELIQQRKSLGFSKQRPLLVFIKPGPDDETVLISDLGKVAADDNVEQKCQNVKCFRLARLTHIVPGVLMYCNMCALTLALEP